MHILIIPSWYKSSSDPLLGSFFEEQARALQSAGHKVGILYPDFHPPSSLFKKGIQIPYFVNDNGLPTFSVNNKTIFPGFRLGNYWYHGVLTAKVFDDYVKQFGKPDILHSHSVNHAGTAAIYLSRRYNLPHVITEHLTTVTNASISNPIDFKFIRKIFKTTDKTLVVSSVFKDLLIDAFQLHPSYFEVVHNMVNDLFFEKFKPAVYTSGDEFVFLTTSFLKKRKNHKLLFDALKILKDRNYKVKLRVGGYGPEENDLRSYVNQQGLENSVEFTGSLTRQQVKQQLDFSHAFILPSLFETFGVVLIESLASGRPIISTDSKGPRDIITNENGILVQGFDEKQLAEAMIKLITNYSQYDQHKISDQCRKLYSEQSITSKLVAIYREVLHNRKMNYNPFKEKEHKDLVITFDYELFLGKRSGSVENCMLKPTGKLLNMMAPYRVKAIFFVDTTYLIRLKEMAQTNENCHRDFEAISLQLQQMIREGHYVFPHIHPHWIDAVYIESINEWNVENSTHYRFANISEQKRSDLFDQSIDILKEIIAPVKSGYKINAFRAGGWSIQPFSDFKPHFIKHDIKYEFSVLDRAYQFTDAQYFDFSSRPDKLIYNFEDDVCIENFNGQFIQFVNSTIKLDTSLQQKNRVVSKVKRMAMLEKTQDIGQGQRPAKNIEIRPASENGFPASGANHFYLSIDMLTETYLPAYQSYFENHYYMHFVSHPKMIKPGSFKAFGKFLRFAFNKFKVETNFIKMIP